jgi:multiple sugar transport system permease protein/sn-glycerol 3-phosphate transport system permease protein
MAQRNGIVIISPTSKIALRESLGSWLFLSPALIAVLLFLILPAVYVTYISLFQSTIVNPTNRYIGLANYGSLLRSASFGNAMIHTIVLAVGVTIVVVSMGLALAVQLDKNLRGTRAFRVIFFLPYVFPLVSSGLAFMWLLQPQYGLLDSLLTRLGLPAVNWLGNVHTALLMVIAVTIWEYLGFYMLIFLGGLQAVDVNIKEAAAVDGATNRTIFWRVVIPSISPSLFFALVISVVQAFQAFDQIYIMTQGGPVTATTTLTYYIYTQGFQFFNMGKASAVAVLLLILLTGLTFLQFLLGKKWVVTDN